MVFVFLVGKLLLSLFAYNEESVFATFASAAVGLLAVIFLYSTVRTGGATVNLGFLLLGVILLYQYRGNLTLPSMKTAAIKQGIMQLTLFLIPIFVYQSISYFDGIAVGFKQLHIDHYYFPYLVNGLKLTGVEDIHTDLHFYSEYEIKGKFTYHYAELWLAAFFSDVLGHSSLVAYYLITVVCCATIYGVGIYAIVAAYSWHTFYKYTFAFAGMLMCGVYFPFYEDFQATQYFSQADSGILSFFWQKHSLNYVFLLLGIHVLWRGHILLGFLVLLLLPIFSITFLPAIIGGVWLYLLLSVGAIWRKPLKEERIVMGASIALILFVMVFYSIHAMEYSAGLLSNSTLLAKVFSLSLGWDDLKPFIANNFYLGMRLFAFYAPYGLVLFMFYIHHKKIALLIAGCTFAGAFTASLLFDVLNAVQFFNINFIFFNIATVYGLALLLEKLESGRIKRYIAIGLQIVLLCLGIINAVSAKNKLKPIDAQRTSTFKEIAEYIDESPCKVLCFLNEKNMMAAAQSYSLSWWYPQNYLWPITQFTSAEVIFSLGNPELYMQVNPITTAADSAYLNYLAPASRQGNPTTPDVCAFIREQGIRWIYVKQGVELPCNVIQRVKQAFTAPPLEGTLYLLK